MPRSFRSIFSQQQTSRSRVDRFLRNLEMGASEDGVFGKGQPNSRPYRFRDPETGEDIWLWRTADDEERQSRYYAYREVQNDGGMKLAMSRVVPELFATNTKTKQPQRVHAYDIPLVLTGVYQGLTNGKQVELRTDIEPMDDAIEQMNLAEKFQQWTYEASIYGYVGIQVMFNFDEEAIDIVRIWPDFLYPMKNEHNQDEIEAIAKRTWVPMEHVREWQPVRIETSSPRGLQMDRVKRKNTGSGESGAAPEVFDVTQDGFVLEELHHRGWIEYAFYAVSQNRILCRVPLELYSEDLAKHPIHLTGLSDFAITLYNNTADDGKPRSDWDLIFDHCINFNVRATKSSRLVDKYSAPRAVVPQSHIQVDPVTGLAQWGMGDSEVIVARPTDQMKPEFLQPNPSFEAPMENLKFQLSMLGMLSQARFAIDPEIAEEVSSGVELKLKMAPALMRVKRRKTDQENAARRVLYNMLSAVEFYTSNEVPGSARDAKQDLLYAGELAGHLKSLTQKSGAMKIRKGRHLTFDKFAHALKDTRMKHHTESTGMPTTQDAVNFLLKIPDNVGAQNMGTPDQPQNMLPAQQIGQNQIPMREAPMGVPSGHVQQAADAAVVLENIVSIKDMTVRFMPGLPQDEAEARASVGITMSTFRFLTEVEGMSDDEANEEIERIRKEQSTATEAGPTDDFGEPMSEPEAVLDECETECDEITAQGKALDVAAEGEAAVGAGEAAVGEAEAEMGPVEQEGLSLAEGELEGMGEVEEDTPSEDEDDKLAKAEEPKA